MLYTNTHGFVIEFTVYEDEEQTPMDLTDYNVTVATELNGINLTHEVVKDPEDPSKVYFTVPNNLLFDAGTLHLQLIMEKDTVRLTSDLVEYPVEKSIIPEA